MDGEGRRAREPVDAALLGLPGPRPTGLKAQPTPHGERVQGPRPACRGGMGSAAWPRRRAPTPGAEEASELAGPDILPEVPPSARRWPPPSRPPGVQMLHVEVKSPASAWRISVHTHHSESSAVL